MTKPVHGIISFRAFSNMKEMRRAKTTCWQACRAKGPSFFWMIAALWMGAAKWRSFRRRIIWK